MTNHGLYHSLLEIQVHHPQHFPLCLTAERAKVGFYSKNNCAEIGSTEKERLICL